MEGTPRQSSSAPSPLRLRDECFRVPDEGEIPRSKFETSPLASTSCSRPASLNSTCQMSEEAASSNSADADAPEEEVHASKSAIVYVKNLPCKVGCQRMMLELKALGLDGCYDFLHFPTKPSHGKETCVGYGFIHFTRDDYASYFMSMFENHYFDDIHSEKMGCGVVVFYVS
eukprot:TRINITY_DN8543_c1_g3_i2.p1 TRINITY_DN8543_c1_g3~~TRINITY_DN8543_c1_g3_i2.p1  ORF type:complete len:172 (-),score=25.92 TRINITY_DN8543_c1_g3_i2:219-734(-)